MWVNSLLTSSGLFDEESTCSCFAGAALSWREKFIIHEDCL